MTRTLPQLRGHLVSELHGIGPRKVESLAELDIRTVLDLLTHYPRRYIDRTHQTTIDQLTVGEEAVLLVTVQRASTRRSKTGKSITEVTVRDSSRKSLRLSFFNQPWRSRQLADGSEVLLYGKVAIYRGQITLANPSVDLVGDQTGRVVPVYPQSEKAGLTSREIGVWVREALERAKDFADPLPDEWRDELDLQSRTWAFRQIHEPEVMGAKEAARRRLAFDELLRLQVLLVQRKRRVERESVGIRHVAHPPLVEKFVERLPFALTGAQRAAIEQIGEDLSGPHPMHRLLQGDVGSGKTLVAVAAMLTGVQGGHQGALLAPTEVLAEQHDANVRELVRDLSVDAAEGNLFGERPVKVELLTGRTTGSERRAILAGLAAGDIDMLVGTHALLTESVEFHDLGVVVVDEQHRFGVEQRSLLREKGTDAVPDVLVMTATPIPRTAAMTVYGDLDVTTLDELPPGRTPIATVWAVGPLAEAETWAKVREEVAAGHQAYVVCPLVEESERVQAASATKEFERLAAGELAGLELGLLHGQMPSKDKEAAMERFRSGRTGVLVATTVIEVGVDVPNATVMVILDADRFGIAQLHQLRGRVGRGAASSWCYLMGEATTDEGSARLKALEGSTDGFKLAEVDLQLRGEGTILGVRQKGRNDLKLANLRRDRDLVEGARRVAFALVGDGTGLAAHPLLEDEVRDLVDDDEAEYLFKG